MYWSSHQSLLVLPFYCEYIPLQLLQLCLVHDDLLGANRRCLLTQLGHHSLQLLQSVEIQTLLLRILRGIGGGGKGLRMDRFKNGYLFRLGESAVICCVGVNMYVCGIHILMYTWYICTQSQISHFWL